MAPNNSTDQPNPLEQIQAREKENQGVIDTIQVGEALGRLSERGRECQDMIDILKAHGFDEDDIKDALCSFWGLSTLKFIN